MDSVFNGDVASALFNTLITVTVPVLVACLVLGVKHVADFLRAKAGKEQWAFIETLSASTVSAVEQKLASADGSLKKTQAVDILKQHLKRHGITLTDDTISATIEASVKAAKDAAAR
jgi:LL-H family phage holin